MFQASGTVIEFPGFMKATGEGRRASAESKKGDAAGSVEQAAQSGKSSKADKKSDDNVSLPPMNPGDALAAVAVGADGHETQPPARYTEASLVKTLEQKESAARPRMRALFPRSSIAGTCMSAVVR